MLLALSASSARVCFIFREENDRMKLKTQKALDRIVGIPLLMLLKPIVLAAG